jgi:hypothetical protein
VNTNAFAKAGVMIREDATPGAPNALAYVSAGNGLIFSSRVTRDGATTSTSATPVPGAAPYWVRVVRSGNTFTGYSSATGTAWIALGSISVPMAAQAYVGLAVTSLDPALVTTGTFSNVTVTVPVSNNPPTLTQPVNQTSVENAADSLQLVASDPDGGALTYSATGLPPSLTVNAATGMISGTPTFTSAGTYSVTATASDGTLSNSKTFTWTVTNVNQAPTLTQPANQTSAENATVSLALVASDPDGTAVTYSATSLPASLSVNTATGLISGTLTATSAGTYSVTATASDGSLTNSKTFTWTVTNVNQAPTLTQPVNQTNAENAPV